MPEAIKTGNGKILLSVCIPTFNRPKQIERLLKEIVPQLRPGVEVVIRDDSSNPETEKVVADYLKKAPISYFHGERLGYDRSILFLVEKARGEYVWFFGDDEMADGAISHALGIIKKFPEASFIYWNSASLENREQLALRLGPDRFFRDRNEVIEEVSDLLAFPSALFLKKSKIMPGLKPAERYIGSVLVHFYLALQVLSEEGKTYFVNGPYIFTEPKLPEQPLWYDAFEVFGVKMYRIVLEFKGKFDKKAMKKMLAVNFGGVWRGILTYRAKGYTEGLGSKSPKFWKICRLYWSFPEFWLALPFLMMPRFVLRYCYRIYKVFFPKGRERFKAKEIITKEDND